MEAIKQLMACVTVSTYLFPLLTNASSVPVNNTICLSESLLKSTSMKTCGDHMCDFDSYCGDDGRCLYCSDADCKVPPPGCQITCLLRNKGKFKYNMHTWNILKNIRFMIRYYV
jgi:hypothetical protein